MERCIQHLAHAAAARHLHERLGRQVLQAQQLRARQRMVAPAHQVEAVGAEDLGAQLGRVGTRGGEREVGAAAAHAVEAGVGQHVGHVELDPRIGMAEPGQHRGQPARGQRRQQRHRDAPAAPRGVVAHVAERLVHVVQQALRRGQEEPAFGRELDVAGVAIEELRAHRGLERADERAEGGLREMAAAGRPGEALQLGERREGAQLAARYIHLHGESIHPFFRIHRLAQPA
jgi:hypothetical protein